MFNNYLEVSTFMLGKAHFVEILKYGIDAFQSERLNYETGCT
jgi:hypothetical protein